MTMVDVQSQVEDILAGMEPAPQVGDRRPHRRSTGYRDGYERWRICSGCGQGDWIQEMVMSRPKYTGLCLPCRAKSHCAEINERKRGHELRGADHPNWKGGRTIDKQGYVKILLPPEHPFYAMANPTKDKKTGRDKSRYVLEHRLKKAQELGRCLTSKEIVHHEFGEEQDNAPEKLEVTNRKDHIGITRKTKRENKELMDHIRYLESENKRLRDMIENSGLKVNSEQILS